MTASSSLLRGRWIIVGDASCDTSYRCRLFMMCLCCIKYCSNKGMTSNSNFMFIFVWILCAARLIFLASL
jgi:hypothetical protein